MTKVWWDFSLVNHLSKQVGRKKFEEFTIQPITSINISTVVHCESKLGKYRAFANLKSCQLFS